MNLPCKQLDRFLPRPPIKFTYSRKGKKGIAGDEIRAREGSVEVADSVRESVKRSWLGREYMGRREEGKVCGICWNLGSVSEVDGPRNPSFFSFSFFHLSI